MKLEDLIIKMGKCNKCTNLGKCSLINYYNDPKFALSIPSIWTDWENRKNSNLMIIGQDWGPYEDMKYLYSKLNKDKSNWYDLIEEENSLTTKKLKQFIFDSSNGLVKQDDIYITNAIKCGRTDIFYRGNNINLKKSAINCSEYLLDEINIVKPKVIFTLGYYPLLALSKIYNFSIKDSLKENIGSIFKVEDLIIIPGFHPVAQISNEEQLKQYRRIWEYLSVSEVVKNVRDNFE